MTLENIIDTANALGWTVTEDSSFKHSPRTITFSHMSSAGEDFGFDVYTDDDNEVPQKVRDYANDFDVDDHAKEVMGMDGAPSLEELLDDAKEILASINELADTLEKGKTSFSCESKEKTSFSCESKEDAYDYIIEHFDIGQPASRILNNILEYADKMANEEQYEFFREILDGTIGLTEDELKSLCWN